MNKSLLQPITKLLKGSGSCGSITGVVINRYQRGNARHQTFAAGLEATLGDLLLKQRIGLRAIFEEANDTGKAVWDLREGAYRSASLEIQDVIREVISRIGLY